MEISEPKPEQALEAEPEAETKSPEAPPEAEPVTEQPQKNEDVGQTANADKAPEKVTFHIPGRSLHYSYCPTDSVQLKIYFLITIKKSNNNVHRITDY